MVDDQCKIKQKLKALLDCDNPNNWDEAILKFEERFDMGDHKSKDPNGGKKMMWFKATNRHIMERSVAK